MHDVGKSEAPYSVLEYGAVHDTVSRVTRETPVNSSGGVSLKGAYLPPPERGGPVKPAIRAVKNATEFLKALALVFKYLAEVIKAAAEYNRSKNS